MDKFERYITSIKRKYRERLINRENQWPPCKSNKLVRLELVEGVKGEGYYARHMRGQESEEIKRTPIEYVDLFKVESGKAPIRKILVEGDAGIGKTTLSIAVCEDWANERLFQQFKLLLLLPLRHKKVASVASLPELLKLLHSSKELCSSVAEYLSDCEGDEVLIIADGWDEIGKCDNLKESFLYELLFEGHLAFASVIVTSRHSASVEFHKLPYFDRFVEITGFDKENIVNYIHSEFTNEQNKADVLRQQLEDNPLVESVCSVPLNCAIICYLWQHKHKETLPTTMTKLYSTIIRNVIFRNIGKNSLCSPTISRLSSFDDLPDDLKQPWLLLCRFAFETMVKDQIVFSGDELNEGLEPRKYIFCFGLLQQSLFLLDDGFGKSYHFLHRTFQEFLAAFHLAKVASESSVSVKETFQSHAELASFDTFWRFFFGIFFNMTKYNNCFSNIKPYLSYVGSVYKKHYDYQRFNLLLCHSAFEAKNVAMYDGVIQAFMRNANGSVILGGSHSAHDCAAVIDVINHMQDDRVFIYFQNCGLRQDQVKRLGEVLLSHKELWVNELKLNGNKLETVESLFSRPFYSLEHLNLSDNIIKNLNFFKSPFNKLTYIDLSNNPLGVSGMNMLQGAIAGNSLTNLESLDLKKSLTRDNGDMIDPIELSKFLGTLSAHCPHLIKLDLSQNNLGLAGALEVAKVKSQYKNCNSDHQHWLTRVFLDEIKLGDDGLSSFTKTLECACYFSLLRLGGNDIHATGLRCLVDALSSGKIIAEEVQLGLEGNPLGLKGVIEIGKLLSSNCVQLEDLNLKRCQLTNNVTYDRDVYIKTVGLQLCQIPQNDTLTYLHLDGNKFSGDGIDILAGFMHVCSCLNHLNTINCAISSSDFNKLLDKVANFRLSSTTNTCRKLSIWSLRGNRIDHEGVHALIKHKPSSLFPRLEAAYKGDGKKIRYSAIDFGDNPISDEMIQTLNKMWKERQEVRCTLLLASYLGPLRGEEKGPGYEANIAM